MTHAYTVVDITQPTIDLRTPPHGAIYEQGEAVDADFDCDDETGGSGIVFCEGTADDGSAVDTSTLGSHSFTVTATDLAGNTSSVTHRYMVVDVTDPTVDLRTPPDGAVYEQGEAVTADFGCDDETGGSGLATCVGTVADGSAVDTSTLGSHSFTVAATDHAGNTFSVTHSYRVVDVTDPTIDLRAPAEGAVYEQGEAVEADFDCDDEVGGSGVASCVGTMADGAEVNTSALGAHSFMVLATDNAGNTFSVTHGYTVVDVTDPTIDLRTPPDGAVYERNEAVEADFSCRDEAGGSGLSSCVGTVADGSGVDTSAQGSHSFTVTATDLAGNTLSVTHGYTVVDVTDPTVALRTPPDGATYDRFEPVEADFDCDDETGGSGIAACVGTVADGSGVDTSTLGAHSFTVTATDTAGNTFTVTHRYTVVDVTEPTVDLRTPPDDAVYEQGESVTADFSCRDETGGSGLASCVGTVADGSPVGTSSLGAHSFTVTATDTAGNTFSVTHGYSVADVTDPTVDLRTPTDGAVYEQGESVAADFSCRDEAGGSGVASCVGTVADGSGVDTSTLGAHSFTVTATDLAGNTASVTHGYTVADVTDPTVDLRTPTDGAVYEQGEAVEADFDCDDEAGGSGLASCVGTVDDGSAVSTSTLGSHNFTVTATDLSGNTASMTHRYTVVDVNGPTVVITTPAEGAVYEQGEILEADFSCDDEPGGSGVESCLVLDRGVDPVVEADRARPELIGGPIDTSSAGPKSLTVIATDRAAATPRFPPTPSRWPTRPTPPSRSRPRRTAPTSSSDRSSKPTSPARAVPARASCCVRARCPWAKPWTRRSQVRRRSR